MDPVSAEFVCTHVSPLPDSVHGTNEKPSLKLLLEESRTPSTSVVTRAELYSLTNASLKTTMPETGTNGAVGGKNPVTGPPKTDDSANTGPEIRIPATGGLRPKTTSAVAKMVLIAEHRARPMAASAMLCW